MDPNGSGGGRRERNFRDDRNHSIWFITDSMFTKCWIVKSVWTKGDSFVLITWAKSPDSSDPASQFSCARTEGSTVKLSKQHGVSSHQRQFPALTKQIHSRGAGVSVFLSWAQPAICIVTWISNAISPSCLICISNSVL